MKKKTKIMILVLITLLFLFSFYLHYENTKLYVSDYNIINDKIPDAFNNYKIVQISDFHNTKYKSLTNDLLKEIKKQKPNIIVITGDLIDSRKYDLQVALDFIEEINDVAPIYFVSGNHEVWSGKYEEIMSKLTEYSVNVFDDNYEIINIDNESIAILGVSDPSFYPSYISDQIDYDLENIVEDIEEDNMFKILLSHRPELFEKYVLNHIDLTLTGHAHGGQFRIPFIGGVIAPDQGLFPKYSEGIFEEENTQMIVSRGIGNSVIPFRINNRPELVVITLHNK